MFNTYFIIYSYDEELKKLALTVDIRFISSIDWSRIPDTWRSQYAKERSSFVNTYGVPYDYRSIMHYPNQGKCQSLLLDD